MLGWLWKDILWACQALLISTRSTPPGNKAKKVRYTRDNTKLFLAPKGPVLGENVCYRSPKVIYLPNKRSFQPPARIHWRTFRGTTVKWKWPAHISVSTHVTLTGWSTH
jgi:hypothetical protein